MTRVHRGVMRLSLFAGGIGALLWLAWVFLGEGRVDMPLILIRWGVIDKAEGTAWLIVPITLVCFAVPYAFVRAVAWVVRGFTQGGGRKKGGEG